MANRQSKNPGKHFLPTPNALDKQTLLDSRVYGATQTTVEQKTVISKIGFRIPGGVNSIANIIFMSRQPALADTTSHPWNKKGYAGSFEELVSAAGLNISSVLKDEYSDIVFSTIKYDEHNPLTF